MLPLSGYGPDETNLFEQVLALREKQRGLGDPRTAESLSTLAAMLSTPADYQRTRALFTRALDAQERFLGPDHPEIGAAATNLANVLARTGDGEKAEQLYRRAVSIWEGALGAHHPKVATGLANLAGHYLRAGNALEAGPLLARALAIQEKALGSAHPDVAATLSRQAEVYARAGATAEAFTAASRAEIISREHLRLTVRVLPERQALAYASSLPPNVGLMLRLAVTRPDDSEMITRAWDAVVRARGIVFDEMAARRSVAAADGSHIQALASAVTSARQRLATLAVRGVRNDAPARHRQLLDHARTEKERAERDLAEHSVEFREDESKRRVLLRNVSAALPEGAALIAFVKAPGSANDPDVASASPAPRSSQASYFALVLSPGESRPALVALGGADTLEALILQWRKQIDQEAMAAGRSARRNEAAYRRVAGELRKHVWDRLSPHLLKAARVFVVPDGALHVVSFAALPAGASGYLIETGPVIHYLSTERDLVPAEAQPATGHGLLALGGAEFDRSDVSSAADASFRGTRQGCPAFERVRFEPLPASLEEVDDVIGLWDQAHRDAPPRSSSAIRSPEALRLTGAAASESSLKAEAIGRRILHLATHGFFLGPHCGPAGTPSAEGAPSSPAKIFRDNPLLMSGLILAGANRRMAVDPGEEDGVLTAEEVAALDLGGVEWAVLSGCDTGIGEVRSGEGVFGLRRAFQEAGARTVIMTLWPVEDQATRFWMSTLYRSRLIEHLSTADSVRAAGLAIVRERRAKRLSSHPFYWGAFVAAGDWR